MLAYTLAALVVALATPRISTQFVPFLLVMIAVLVALVPAKRGSHV
jgi:hypothetical protein